MAIKGESYERDTMYPQFLMENRSSANGGTEGTPWPHEAAAGRKLLRLMKQCWRRER